MAGSHQVAVLTGRVLRQRDIADAAVPKLAIVSMDESLPDTDSVRAGKSLGAPQRPCNLH
jgi:hypothetical protein